MTSRPIAHAVRVAAVQTAPVLGDVGANLEAIRQDVERLVQLGANLIVFPECQLSGYAFDDREAAIAAARRVPGPETDAVHAWCRAANVHVAFGLLERDDEHLYNTAVIVGPEGLRARYRKTHLPRLGADRWTTVGYQPYEPIDTPVGRLGIVICYDARFPEAPRVLALRGAEILLLPTNWPKGSEVMPEHGVRVRAFENRVYVIVASRVANDRGTSYIGRSQIVDVSGAVLAEADGMSTRHVVADIAPERARDKTVGPRDAPLADLFLDRRPGLYALLAEPTSAPFSADTR
jgi:predicted amidohydrolase